MAFAAARGQSRHRGWVDAGSSGGERWGASRRGAGWVLPNLFFPRPHEFEGLALLGFKILGVGIGATVGLIVGGALVARFPRPPQPKPGTDPCPSTGSEEP